MSSVLQVQQFYTAGIPLLEAYLLPMANNRTHKERLSQEQNGRYPRGPDSYQIQRRSGIRILYTYVTSSGNIRYGNRSYAVLVQ